MQKSQVIFGTFIFTLLILTFAFYNFNKFTGLTVYDCAATDFCGSTVTTDSSLTASHTCDGSPICANSASIGGTLSSPNIIMDCGSFIVDGALVGGAFGIKVNNTAPNVIIKRCNVKAFVNSINISSNNVSLIDSILNGAPASTVEAWINSSVNATFLNVSFTDTSAKIVSSAGSNLFVQYYVIVNVTNNATGATISGANVSVNATGLTGVLTGTSNANGLAFFNVTERVKRAAGDGGDVELFYTVNATSSGLYGVNNSYNVAISSGTQMVNIFASDTTPPSVTIVSPANTSYLTTSLPLLFNVTLNENGSVMYSLNNGVTNFSMTGNESVLFGTGFNASNGSIAVGSYVFSVYANDTAGNRNDTVNVTFSVTAPAAGGGGGGDGGGGGGISPQPICVFNCGNWSDCVAGNQSRICTYSCTGVQKTEIQGCVVTACLNECPFEGKSCSNGVAIDCKFIDGCFKVVSSEDCFAKDTSVCLGGSCISCSSLLVNVTLYVGDNVSIGGISDESSRARAYEDENRTIFGFRVPNIPRPSDFIPHGNIPAGVVDAGAGVVAVGGIAGISWIIWIWVASLFLPLFLIKLRHYIVPVIDGGNAMEMFEDGRLKKQRTLLLLKELKAHFGEFVFADGSHEMARYLVPRGFVELRFDEPFVLTGHFTTKGDAYLFKNALRKVVNKFGGKDLKIFDSVERASIIEAWRAYFRNKKTDRELKKVFRR